jgi:hypothetical protein
VPRPEIIDRLFEARYEYEMTRFAAKAQAEERYQSILVEVTDRYHCSKDELLSSRWYREYYREWRRQNGLSKPPKA